MARSPSVARGLVAGLAVLLLASCATAPVGPSRMALPGTGRSFESFRLDDTWCRRQAAEGASGAQSAVNDAAAATTLASTAVGALAGAALGGHQGAGVGAGAGLLVGASAAGQNTAWAGPGVQRNYDQIYLQCMYARGHRVPASGVFTVPTARPAPAPVPSSSVSPSGTTPTRPAEPPPPPPPGPPPPPPPGLR